MAASPVFQSPATGIPNPPDFGALGPAGRPFILFPPPASLLAQLRDTPKLAAIAPASQLEVRPAPEMLSSGIPELDMLTGGWPRGCLSEICGSVSSGRTSIALSALAQATQRGEACALVDASDALDPASAAAAGIATERLLWIRCGKPVLSSQFSVPSSFGKDESHLNFCEERNLSPRSYEATEKVNEKSSFTETKFDRNARKRFEQRLEQVLKITDLLLQSNGFGMIVLDLADIPVLNARRIPLASWFRFRRVVEHTPTVLLVIEQQPIAGSCSSLLVQVSSFCRDNRVAVSGKKPSAFSCQHSASRTKGLRPAASIDQEILSERNNTCGPETMSSRPSHAELLDRFEITAELLRSRLDRKPMQSVVNFHSRAKWRVE